MYTAQRWDFQYLATSDYAIQEIFLAAATLEFTLSFIHQMELLPFILSPAFWVEMATLPPCIVVVQLAFAKLLGDYRVSQILLLMGCLRWLKSFGGFVLSQERHNIVFLYLSLKVLLLVYIDPERNYIYCTSILCIVSSEFMLYKENKRDTWKKADSYWCRSGCLG